MSREIIKIPIERRNGRVVIDNANGEDAILRNKLIAMGKLQGVVPSEGWDKWAAVSIRNLLDLFENIAWQQASEELTSEACPDRPR